MTLAEFFVEKVAARCAAYIVVSYQGYDWLRDLGEGKYFYIKGDDIYNQSDDEEEVYDYFKNVEKVPPQFLDWLERDVYEITPFYTKNAEQNWNVYNFVKGDDDTKCVFSYMLISVEGRVSDAEIWTDEFIKEHHRANYCSILPVKEDY